MYVRGMGCDRHLLPVLNTDAVYMRVYLKVSKVLKPRMDGGIYGNDKGGGKIQSFGACIYTYIHV